MTAATISAPEDSKVPAADDVGHLLCQLGAAARRAALMLAQSTAKERNGALLQAAINIRGRVDDILHVNKLDCEDGAKRGLSPALLDRLAVDASRVEAMAVALEDIAALPDPIGSEIAAWERPNGLRIARVRTPLGVIGVIYESRPNVTADAGGLCLKAGNASILRCGSESFRTSSIITECLIAGLVSAGLPDTSIQLVPTTDRQAVGAMLRMPQYLDVIVPRGGKSLIERVMADSKVPLFNHLEGLCHTYVHAVADLEKARRVVFNAKMRRPGICGATETLLVDQAIAAAFLPGILDDLIAAGCEVRGDAMTRAIDGRVLPASEADWQTEYLDKILAVKTVADFDAALAHVARYSSGHTEAILTEDRAIAEAFIAGLDSAIVMVNSSTQFADGGEFGMGAEIGIATGKLHARGPVGVEQLTSFKYVVRGNGQCRA